MVRRQPQLVPTILRTVFDLEFPDQADATISSESFADFEPAELRCDATVLLDDPSKPSHGVVVEVQTRFEKESSTAGPPTWPRCGAATSAARPCWSSAPNPPASFWRRW